jgi:hypothetical protein
MNSTQEIYQKESLTFCNGSVFKPTLDIVILMDKKIFIYFDKLL